MNHALRIQTLRLGPLAAGLAILGCCGAAEPAPTTPGVFAICLSSTMQRPDCREVLAAILDLESVSGLLVYVDWNRFEPREGEFRHEFFDLPLELAAARGKTTAFALVTQARSPDWLLRRVPTFTFEHYHPSVGTVTSPVPWDPAYREALFRTVRALGDRLDGRAGLAYMSIGGPSSLFGVETNFPVKHLEPDQAAVLGYSDAAFEQGWREAIDVYSDAFPRTALALGLHTEIGIGDTPPAEQVRIARAIRDAAIDRQTRDGKRMIVRLLGLGPPHPARFAGPYRQSGEATTAYTSLVGDVRGRADIALEAARIWRNPNVGGKQRPLTPARFRDVLQLAIANGAARIEIKDADILNLADKTPYAPHAPALAETHARLTGTAAPPAKPKPPLFAVYYTWYTTGTGPHATWSAWGTDKPSLLRPQGCDPNTVLPPPHTRDISSCAYPLLDVYDSDDRDIVRSHIRMAKAAGIDAFLVDWWGPAGWQGVPGLTHDAFVNAVLPVAEEEGFKVCLFDETAQFVKNFDEVKEWAAKYLGQFKDSPAYLRIDGQPVYVIYQVPFAPSLKPEQAEELCAYVEEKVGPVYWIFDKIANGPDPATGGFTSFIVPEDWLGRKPIDAFCAYGTFSVQRIHGYRDLAPRFATMAALAHDAGHRIMLPVHPGHDNSKIMENPWVIPRRDGDTLREYLHAAEDAGADFILVTSFNEWPETTVVEPARTWPDPYLYLRILAEWKGIGFRPPDGP